jgi:hypothetical protein
VCGTGGSANFEERRHIRCLHVAVLSLMAAFCLYDATLIRVFVAYEKATQLTTLPPTRDRLLIGRENIFQRLDAVRILVTDCKATTEATSRLFR